MIEMPKWFPYEGATEITTDKGQVFPLIDINELGNIDTFSTDILQGIMYDILDDEYTPEEYSKILDIMLDKGDSFGQGGVFYTKTGENCYQTVLNRNSNFLTCFCEQLNKRNEQSIVSAEHIIKSINPKYAESFAPEVYRKSE